MTTELTDSEIMIAYERHVDDADPLSGPDYGSICEEVAHEIGTTTRRVADAVLNDTVQYLGA